LLRPLHRFPRNEKIRVGTLPALHSLLAGLAAMREVNPHETGRSRRELAFARGGRARFRGLLQYPLRLG
jgi:hypothetical protein